MMQLLYRLDRWMPNELGANVGLAILCLPILIYAMLAGIRWATRKVY